MSSAGSALQDSQRNVWVGLQVPQIHQVISEASLNYEIL